MSIAGIPDQIGSFCSLLRRNRLTGRFVNVYSPISKIGIYNAGL